MIVGIPNGTPDSLLGGRCLRVQNMNELGVFRKACGDIKTLKRDKRATPF